MDFKFGKIKKIKKIREPKVWNYWIIYIFLIFFFFLPNLKSKYNVRASGYCQDNVQQSKVCWLYDIRQHKYDDMRILILGQNTSKISLGLCFQIRYMAHKRAQSSIKPVQPEPSPPNYYELSFGLGSKLEVRPESLSPSQPYLPADWKK